MSFHTTLFCQHINETYKEYQQVYHWKEASRGGLKTFTVPFCFAATLTHAQRQASLPEIQALTAFKCNLYHPFGALDGWDASTSSVPCNWCGVGCEDNRVQELRLPRLHLSGQITDHLTDLRDLCKPSLHSNNLNGSIPLFLPVSLCGFSQIHGYPRLSRHLQSDCGLGTQ
ncbi:hypothetical protein ACFX13_012787 [Malus domestica]